MGFKRVFSLDSFFLSGKKKAKVGDFYEGRSSSCNALEDKVQKEVTWADDLVEIFEVSPAPTPPPWPPIKVPWWERCFACFCCCYEADF